MLSIDCLKGEYAMNHHIIDIHPIPDGQAYFINEPWLIDDYMFHYGPQGTEPDPATDNIRVYVPLDLNHAAILRRLDLICSQYGDVSWKNESAFSCDVAQLIEQIEIYDQIWSARHPRMKDNHAAAHSAEAIGLVRDVIRKLQEVGENGNGDMFPYETIEELTKEYMEG